MSEKYYPPAAFYFKLSISGKKGEDMASFKEVSGISMDMGIEEIKEGGENIYSHIVPTKVKYNNLVLKRGVVLKDSAIAKWCLHTLNGRMDNPVETKPINVKLMDENGTAVVSWNFINAWPVKWSLVGMDDMGGEIAVENLEFAYSYFEKKESN